jgi:thymidine kinase
VTAEPGRGSPGLFGEEVGGLEPRSGGGLEVICGPMFSGKTEELIRRLRRAVIARRRVVVLKPGLDDRYAVDHLVSHSAQRVPSLIVRNSAEVFRHGREAEVVGIDETQFLDEGIVEVCERLADAGKRVIVAGLDLDYRGVPFEPIPQLLARAEYITKTLAICVVCGAPAGRTQRVAGRDERILVGSTEFYEARCRGCYRPPEEE